MKYKGNPKDPLRRLDAREVAAMCNITTNQFYSLVHDGLGPQHASENIKLYRLCDVDKWLAVIDSIDFDTK